MDSPAAPRSLALLRAVVALGVDGEAPPPAATFDEDAWTGLPAAASAHGVVALAHRGVGRLPAASANGGVCAILETAVVQSTAINLAVLSRTLHVSSILQQAGIPSAVSPTAAGVLMLSDFAVCEASEAAVLLAWPHLRRAEDALLSAGYTPGPATKPHQRTFTWPGTPAVAVVLETALSPGADTRLLDSALERVVSVNLSGREIRALALDDRFVALCARAAARQWDRLDYVAAVATLVCQLPSATTVLDRAMELQARASVLASALRARDLVGRENPLATEAARESGAGDDASPLGAAAVETNSRPLKLILRQFQSPGDLVMLTAAVRDLHHHHPGRFVTDVRTSCPDLWLHNPHITPIDDNDADALAIPCEYPLIHRSNQTPYHFIHGFMQFLSDRLGLPITPTAFKGDLHLSADERTPSPLLGSAAGVPYWLVSSGGKFDYTIKWWSSSRYQAVVDHFRGRLLFVQVGEAGHHHPSLDGALDLRGHTSLRDLLRLVYGADGALGPVSLLMHLAAAVETRPGAPLSRPSVVVAGGREPVHWEAYPGHQFLHTIGALPCCATGGCWRSRTLPIGDGDSKDLAAERCVDVVNGLPHCMDMITADDVIRAIEVYHAAGHLRPMSRDEFERLPVNAEPRTAPDRALPIWYQPDPVPRAEKPEITFAVLTGGDRLPLITHCLESIERYCPRARYTLVVGANEVSDRVRELLHRKRVARAIDRLHEAPIDIARSPMMRRLFADVRTDLVWWLDADVHFTDTDGFDRALATVRASPDSTVMWGLLSCLEGTGWADGRVDPVAFTRTARWYRHVPLPGEPMPGGRVVDPWCFPMGGCWIARMSAIRDLDWPDRRLTVPSCFDDALLAEAVRQQGWRMQDVSPLGVDVSDAPDRSLRGAAASMPNHFGSR